MDQLTQALKAKAMALGFDLVGIAAAGPTPGTDRLRAWLAAGMHGGMHWMARTESLRADPRRLLKGCRSVVAVAMSYRSSLPESRSSAADGRVWVSRYAWGRDYHRILKKKLVHLGRWLAHEDPDLNWRACVDTAPAAERSWAAAAGLGWIGKNGQLINRQLGSELFLGLLLCDRELEADPPAAAHCGRCSACLDACPAGAFPTAGVVDARRCIAYLTVEHREPVPTESETHMGAMVAGCDICQEVCPWTRQAPADLHPEFAPAAHRYLPLLVDLEVLDEAAYRQWRTGSPLNRIPFSSFRRNLEIARRNLDRRL